MEAAKVVYLTKYMLNKFAILADELCGASIARVKIFMQKINAQIEISRRVSRLTPVLSNNPNRIAM